MNHPASSAVFVLLIACAPEAVAPERGSATAAASQDVPATTAATSSAVPSASASASPGAKREFELVGRCKLRAGGSPFTWPESDVKGHDPARYDSVSDYAGRWVDRYHCLAIEVHPDGRFRWIFESHSDHATLCQMDGKLTANSGGAATTPPGSSSGVLWWPTLDAFFDAEKRLPHECQQPVGLGDPPIERAPTVVFASADELVLTFPSALAKWEGVKQKYSEYIRLVRFGSAANQPAHESSDMMLDPDTYVIDAGGGRVGELVVSENKEGVKTKPYSLKWAASASEKATSETGQVECVRLDPAKSCAGYRFVPVSGKPWLAHIWPGGQRTLTPVSSESDLKEFPKDRSRGWSLTPLNML